MAHPIELRSSRLYVRSTTELDRTELLRIRATEAVFQRWSGDDLAAEFKRDLADVDLHQCTISTRDGRSLG